MKKMPAFFSGVPGRWREATEEGKNARLSRLARFILRTNTLTPPPLPQAGEGFFFVFSAIFAVIEMGIVEWIKKRNKATQRRYDFLDV